MASSFEPIPDDFWRFDGTPRDGRINPIYDMGIFRDIQKLDMHHSLPYIENLHTYHKWLVYIYNIHIDIEFIEYTQKLIVIDVWVSY